MGDDDKVQQADASWQLGRVLLVPARAVGAIDCECYIVVKECATRIKESAEGCGRVLLVK